MRDGKDTPADGKESNPQLFKDDGNPTLPPATLTSMHIRKAGRSFTLAQLSDKAGAIVARGAYCAERRKDLTFTQNAACERCEVRDVSVYTRSSR